MFWQRVAASAQIGGSQRLYQFATDSIVAGPVPPSWCRLRAVDEDSLWRAVKEHCLNEWCIRQVSRVFREKVDHRSARLLFEELETEEQCQLIENRLLAADLDNWLLTPGGGDDSDYLIERGYLPVRDDSYHDDELGGSY